MRLSKRLFDIGLGLFLLPILGTLMLVVIVTLIFTEGRPFFYAAERMKSPTQSFRLWKFRTMTVVDEDAGVSGAISRRGSPASDASCAGRAATSFRNCGISSRVI